MDRMGFAPLVAAMVALEACSGGGGGGAGDAGAGGSSAQAGSGRSGAGQGGGSAGSAGAMQTTAGSSGGGSGGSGGPGGAGTGGGSGTASPTGPSLDELVELVADAYCDVVEACLPETTIVQYLGPDCRGRMTAMIQDGDFAHIDDVITSGRVSYHPEMVDACLAQLVDTDCSTASLSFNLDPCAQVFVGTVDQGDACNLDEECSEGFCDRTASCPGECVPLRDADEPCEDDDQCTDPLRCDEELRRCVMPGTDGQACGGGVAPDCDLGLICVGDDADASQTGLCRAFDDVLTASLDASCDFDTGQLCEEGLACVVHFEGDMPVFGCVAPSASGAACNFGYPTPCPPSEYCGDIDPESGDVEGTCTPLPEDGEPCVAVAAAPPCAPGLVCDADDLCHALGRLEDDCASDEGCASAHCEGTICQVPEFCVVPRM